MNDPRIVSQAEWLRARKELLEKEKAFSRQRDAIAAARRALPMVKVEKPYVFAAPNGKKSLADLFVDRRQLVVYHFMFDPSWEEGCKSCSFLSEIWDGVIPHLAAQNTSFAAVSRAPLAKLLAYQKRMGWRFPWYSSQESDFNFDFGVSFPPEGGDYNFGSQKFNGTEAPGMSVFVRDGNEVFRAYSTYARGLDTLIGTYNVLDLTPLGRQEEELDFAMSWVRRHDEY
jgi:predicted dithiol-disulfide oxidoreductase (DUF899 family)